MEVVNEKWYHKKRAIVIAFFILPPLALPFIWLSPRTSTTKKIIATILMIAVSWVCWIWLKDTYEQAMIQYRDLKSQMGLL